MPAALRATSSTAAVISFTAVAAIWISSCCWLRVRLLSSVMALISSAAEASWVAEWLICSMVPRSCCCIFFRAVSNCAGSSRPAVSMGPVRSPLATTSAARTAMCSGWVMLRVSSQASSTVASTARASTLSTALLALA